MLSIIILSYKDPAVLRLCLKSLSGSLPTDVDYEVIVVDNETSLQTRNVVTEEFQNIFKHIRLVPLEHNEGYTRGVNEGLRVAQGEYILYSNHDVIFQPGSLDKMYQYLQNNPRVGLLGPKLLNFNGTEQPSSFRFYSPWTIICRRMPYIPFAKKVINRFLMRDVDLSETRSVDWISGAIFMTSRTAINKVGLLDEHLFHYFSDVDWARRFWENGYTVIHFTGAKIFHYHGQASRGRLGALEFIYNRAAIWHIEDGLKYFAKYGFKTPTYSNL